jgi:hypothetical protein
MELPVYLISQELLLNKFFKALRDIGFDDSCWYPDLSEVVFRLCGLQDRSPELYDLYFNLMETLCENALEDNRVAKEEALTIYRTLKEKFPHAN